MNKLIQLPSFQTTDGTIFTGEDAATKAANHQAKLDNGAVIESFIIDNGLIKSAAGAARNLLPKFLAYKAGVDAGEIKLKEPPKAEAGEADAPAGAPTGAPDGEPSAEA